MPELPGLNRPVDLGRRASPDDFGADAAAATAAIAAPISALGQISGQIVNATESARSSLAVAEAKVELRDFTDQLQDSPLQTAGRPGVTQLDLVRDERTRIAERFSKELTGPWRSNFDDAFEVAGDEATLRVSNNIRSRKLKEGRAAADRNVQLLADEGGRAETPDEVSKIRRELDGLVEGWVVSGLITPEEGLDLSDDWERGVSGAKRAKAIRLDPAGAWIEMQDVNSPLVSGRTEVERQLDIKAAADAHRSQLSAERAEFNFRQKQRVEARRVENARLTKDGDTFVFNKDFDGLMKFVGDNPQMEDSLRRLYLQKISKLEGWDSSTAVTDPNLWIDLNDEAARGNPDVIDQATSRLRAGTLTKADFDRVVSISKDVRFGAARRFLRQATGADEILQAAGDRVRSARVLREFEDWVRLNPDAGVDEAQAVANQLRKDAVTVDAESIPGLAVRLDYRVNIGDTDDVDVPATLDATFAAFQRGEITSSALETVRLRLDFIERTQNALRLKP